MTTQSGKVDNSDSAQVSTSVTNYKTMASSDRDRPLFRAGISSPEVFILKLKAYCKRHNTNYASLLHEISL